MTKRIAIFSTFIPPHIGGVEYYTSGLADYLTDIGYDVYVITTTKNHIEHSKYKIIVLESFDLMKDRFPIVITGKINRIALEKIKNLRLDGAIIQTRFYSLSLLAASLLSKNKIPFLLIEHGTGHFVFSNKLLNKLGEWYEHFVTKRIKKKCARFYGVSNACCAWLSHFGIEAQGVLHNSVKLDNYRLTEDEECNGTLINGKTVSNDNINITFIGRLIPEKGIIKLLEAFSEVHNCNRKTHLFVAGTGILYEKYKNSTIDGVTFLGNVEHDEIIKLLRLTNIFCFPSDYPEGLPTTILEAAAAKTLIISSRSGGTEEFIIDEKSGILLKDNTTSEIANTIMKYIELSEERNIISENARARVAELFCWEVVGEQVIKALEI